MEKTEKRKLNILFVHLAYNGSYFHDLFLHLNQKKLANAFFLTNESERYTYQATTSNLLSYYPDGDITKSTYYYSGYAETGSRISLGLLTEVKKILQSQKIDLICTHYIYGCPLFLYDEIDIPIISFNEFPSFRQYKWDEKYPPQDAQRYVDKTMEMLSFYEVLKSDLCVVQNNYTKKMFPKELQAKIKVIPDGFAPRKTIPSTKNSNENNQTFTIGFYARTLSSEKGFEQFIKISKALLEKDQNFRFVIKGTLDGISYGYEKQYFQPLGFTNFKDFVLSKHPISEEKYTFYQNFLSEEECQNVIDSMDICLYPLQQGHAAWGLYELLLKGKPVIASNRCFVPEIITNNNNGIMCDYDDINAWVEAILDLRDNTEKRNRLAKNALESSKQYSIENIAKDYLETFDSVVENYKKE